jgi:hypothetical protein
MTILTPAEVAELQAEHAAAHLDTCQLKATVETDDGHNGYTMSWPAVTATVPCSCLDRGGDAVGQGGLIDVMPGSPQKTFVLPRGTTVEPSWRLVWSGGTYEVADVEPAGSYGPAVYVQAKKVKAV